MERNQAIDLIRDTFTNPFERGRFVVFIRNLLNHVDESKAGRWTKPVIKEAFHGHVNHYERFATYTDPDGQTLDILAVYLKKDTTLDRARTLQRNFVADYLKTGHGQDKAAILAAFISPGAENWRFSFIKREYVSALGESGRVVIETELTPARRFSFLVGLHEATHTAQAQLVPLLSEDSRDPTLAAIEAAFGIERVTQEFFEEYQSLYFKTKEAMDRVLGTNSQVRADFDAKDISPVDFSKKLLGQIVFLYFLQKKGWFGVARDADWGTGPRDFLRRLFAKQVVPYGNFFNDILEPLFYEALAKERDADFYSRFQCKIPFLNGGLFDPIRDYDWVHTDILLPDEVFSNSDPSANGDTGTGILDVFDRYNFTVNEAEPLEKEVAIDPEMLGKVFENLLDVKDRKRKGSYYTPREIVHYMCEQALCYYLETALDGACPRGDLETFIHMGDQFAPYQQARDENEGRLEHYPELPNSIRERAPQLDDALKTITICDPAIGSGAFPVGMLMEIVRARSTLGHLPGLTRHTRYTLKRHAIQNCLYGVDVDPGAVEIAKLRLWLSLVVDEDNIRDIKPLPNLDYKIMQGNSLLDRFDGVRLFDDTKLNLPDFSGDEQKDYLKKQVKSLQRELLSLHGAGKLTKVRRAQIEKDILKVMGRIRALEKPSTEQHVQESLADQFKESRNKLIQMKQKHGEFFEVQSRKKKEELRRELDELEWDFMEATIREEGNAVALRHLQKLRHSAAKPFFLWKLHFGEVFQERGGFDIVIGNPPYVRADVDEAHAKMRREIEESGFYDTLWEKWDLYVPFIERGYKFLKLGGVITYIVSDAFCHSKYAQKPQNWFLRNSRVLRLDFFSKIQIFDAAVRNVTFFFQRADGQMNKPERRVHEGEFGRVAKLSTDEQPKLTCRAFFPEEDGGCRYSNPTLQLDETSYVSFGCRPNSDERVARGQFVVADLLADHKDKNHPKPYIEAKEMLRWVYSQSRWLEWGTARSPTLLARPTFEELYEVSEKIVVADVSGAENRAAYDTARVYHSHTLISVVPWHSLAGVRNNSLRKSARYSDEKVKADLPKREELEATSRRFEVKYLLAVMNSSVARNFLRAHRRSNIHLYPDDWKKLPIPDMTPEQQAPIVALVDRILTALRTDRNSDVSALEAQVDRLVTDLYGVTATPGTATATPTTTTTKTLRPVERDLKEYLRTECLPALATKRPYFTIDDVRAYLQAQGRKTTRDTVKFYMAELVTGDFTYDAGRGWYSALPHRITVNPEPVAEVISRVEKAFPLLEFSCWSTEQVNPHMQHLLTKFVTFIYTDKDLMPAVFEEISTWKDFRTYLKPGAKEAKTFRVEERTIVIRQEISEAPPGEGHVAPFEKLLVDLAVEIERLPLMSKGEFQEMAWRVITSGRVQVAVLVRYARRNHRTLEDIFGGRWSTNGTK